MRAALVFFVQGDAGQGGLPGTLGSAGKAVSMSIIHAGRTAMIFIPSLMCLCVILLSHHRESVENRERWDLLDLLVNL